MIIIAVTQSIFKLGPPDFAWKQIQIISNIYDDDDHDDDEDNDDNDDDDDDDDINDKDDYSCNSVNFYARTSRFCMEVDLDNMQQIMMMVMMIMMMMMMIMMMKMIIAVFAFLAITPPKIKPKNELFLCKNTTFLLNKFFSRMKLKF